MPSELLWKVDTHQKTVFITFDDGPIPGLTAEILDILDDHQAMATFFCVGENVQRHPELFREIRRRGHAVGNHTHHHLKGVRARTRDYLEDVREAGRHIDSGLFRPPYGLITPRQARLLSKHFTVVMWSALTRDYDPDVTAEECLARAFDGVFPGSIIVFHDNLKAREKVLYALPRLLEYLKREDYETACLQSAAAGAPGLTPA
jgi:peptidoglycan/xylan/chitin deacetylase (PgdA/CDA1 family)